MNYIIFGQQETHCLKNELSGGRCRRSVIFNLSRLDTRLLPATGNEGISEVSDRDSGGINLPRGKTFRQSNGPHSKLQSSNLQHPVENLHPSH